jgi:nitrite reductase/ring-hydroxylating ferredoxin subunit
LKVAVAGARPVPTYETILERDTRAVPAFLRQAAVPDLGTDPVAVSRYVTPEFARLEDAYLWPYVWQVACREEQLPHSGDTVLYEIAGRSLFIVRQRDGSIRAFHNSCLHRGRKLVTECARKADFRCPFHGIAWHLDGSFKDNPMAWDFAQWRDDPPALPQAKVECWGGFVFINMDADAAPLATVLGPIQDHFAHYHLDECYIAFHVEKKVRCNWKAVAEAFMESHHTVTTHPQLLCYLSDVNSQYDALNDHVTRQFSAGMVPSPMFGRELTEDEIVQAMIRAGSQGRADPQKTGDAGLRVPDGVTARAFMADVTRRAISAADGVDYSAGSDAELVDALLYNLFPNMSFWAGLAPKLFYRWRPNGRDHDSAIMDIYLLKRVADGQPRPAPAPVFPIGLDESIAERGPLAGLSPGLSRVFEQDMQNLPYVQEGMRSSASGVVHFGAYSEMRLRLMHKMIDDYIARGEARSRA